MIRVTALYTYPIKSCARLSHEEIALDDRGPVYDRRWMVVSNLEGEQGVFLTQRELPELAVVQPAFRGDELALTAPGKPEIRVPLEQQGKADRTVVVWKDTCRAVDQGDAVADWLTDYLDYPARLVRIADEFVRPVDSKYSAEPAQVGFADGYPLLLAAEESLNDLNERLTVRGKATLPMARFRPNMVVEGGGAFGEDRWRCIEVNGISFDVVKPCARCVTTTVDQASGTVPDSAEPLATLATFRKAPKGVMFGQNIIHRAPGTLTVGATMSVMDEVLT